MTLSEFLPIAEAFQADKAPDGSDKYNLGILSPWLNPAISKLKP